MLAKCLAFLYMTKLFLLLMGLSGGPFLCILESKCMIWLHLATDGNKVHDQLIGPFLVNILLS